MRVRLHPYVAGLLVVAAVVSCGDRRERGAVRLPGTVGGQPRLRGGLADLAADATKHAMDDPGAVRAAYGTDDRPAYLFMAEPDPGRGSAETLLDGLGAAAQSSGGAVGDTQHFGDVSCAAYVAGTVQFALCAWSGGGTAGAVISYRETDLATVAEMTAQARAAATG